MDEIESLRPDENTLTNNSESYDIDEDLEKEFNTIQDEIYTLKVAYESLIRTREIATNG